MAFSLFGITLGKTNADNNEDIDFQKQKVIDLESDGSTDYIVTAGGSQTQFLEDFIPTEEIARIIAYREASNCTEVSKAINEIVSDAITPSETISELSVELELDNVDLSDNIKEKLKEEFKYILYLLKYDKFFTKYFKKWYIDGRIYYHKVVEEGKEKEGIKKLINLESTRIKKYREIRKLPKVGNKQSGTVTDFIDGVTEYFIYFPKDHWTTGKMLQVKDLTNVANVLKFNNNTIAYAPSGEVDENGDTISHLHKALRANNQLSQIEDSVVVYRMTRAPERRVFYIDVGKLPKQKAEQHVQGLMDKYRNKTTYNPKTGKMDNGKANMAMLEDFWLPRCFALDTEIYILSKNNIGIEVKTLQELIDDFNKGIINWTYSVSHDNKIVTSPITWAGITRKRTEVLCIELSTGGKFTCTPDHKMILEDGTGIEAQHLHIGDKLKPFNCSLVIVTEISTAGVIDTGTITIDGDHQYHDYHNFPLAAGIFVKNSDGKGTEIDTLSGGDSNMMDSESSLYFRKKLYDSLNVPVTRLESDNMFGIGMGEITRDEIKFSKWINDLRQTFAFYLFNDLLKTQLILKKIINENEWSEIDKFIGYKFAEDSHFAESKRMDILSKQLDILRDINEYSGSYFSKEYIRKNVLRQDEDDQKEMRKQIEKELKDNFEHPKEEEEE